MYFNAETQARILRASTSRCSDAASSSSARPRCCSRTRELFAPLDLSGASSAKSHAGRRLQPIASAATPADAATATVDDGRRAARSRVRAAPVAAARRRRAAARWSLANQRARALFALAQTRRRAAAPGPRGLVPAGRAALADRPGARRAPRGPHRARSSGALGAGDARPRRAGRRRSLGDGAAVGARVTFVDITRYKRLQRRLERSKRELETAYEELQSTVEELETTNEELQSTNEELETTNEELQSTNEELETMNEELQSTNEELETINDELDAAHERAQPDELLPRVDPREPRARRRGARPGAARRGWNDGARSSGALAAGRGPRAGTS